jgi:hypothetical protein
MAWGDDLPRIEPERTHLCEAGSRLRGETERAQAAEANEALWGHAITRIEFAEGRWWAHNAEYATLVRFCPWCGANLETAPTP